MNRNKVLLGLLLIPALAVTLNAFFGPPEGWFELKEVQKEMAGEYLILPEDMWVKVAQKKTDKKEILIQGKMDSEHFSFIGLETFKKIGRSVVTYGGWKFYVEVNGKKTDLRFIKGQADHQVQTNPAGTGVQIIYSATSTIVLPRPIQYYIDNKAVLYGRYEAETAKEETQFAIYQYEFKKPE
jgi:hypothetical protein